MADDPTMTLVDTTVEGQPVDNNSDTAAVVTVSHDPIGWVRRSVRNVITRRSDSTINNNGNYDGNSDKIAHAFKISVHAAIKTYGDKAISVINDELRQMLEKKVFHGVLFTNLSKDERRNIIRSSMFLKEKFLSDGEFEKLKARLVASGDMQDREVYEIDLSSSTAATSSVFLFAAVGAKEGRTILSADVPSAYLNAWMKATGVRVIMRINKTLSKMLCTLDPNLTVYVQDNGEMLVCLDKALYGCIESAKLWYDHLSESLISIGFVCNEYEPCLYNKNIDGVQVSLITHVDDLMISCICQKALDTVMGDLYRIYGVEKYTKGKVHNYIGMTFNFSEIGKVSITMAGYVGDLLTSSGVLETKKTPAGTDLFDIDESSKLLDKTGRLWFHSYVAKLLYIAKRVKPECLTAVSFLTTRVQAPSEQDHNKLIRVIKYVRYSRDRGITIEVGDSGFRVQLLTDASHAVHADMKSHSGSVIVIGNSGRGCISFKSRKQKIIGRSSTDAEFICITDCANDSLHIRNILISQGYESAKQPVLIHQDNQSCIDLLHKSRANTERSRHVDIRRFWLKECIDTGTVEVAYLPTELMYANLLTKPLQGSQFLNERRMMSNWKEEEGNAEADK
jgi:hypothetical protein